MTEIKKKSSTPQIANHLQQGDLLVSTRVKLLLVVLAGLVIGLLSVFVVYNQYTTSLTQRIESMAALIPANQVENIKSSSYTMTQNEHTLKHQLQQAKSANEDVRHLYLMGISTTNTVYYLLDSELRASSAGPTEQGKSFARASNNLKSAFFTGSTLIEGPRQDQYGSWLSASAPVQNSQGETIAMIGMDIPASTYYKVLALAAFIPLVGSLLIAAVFMMTDAIRRRHQEVVRLRSELVSIASHELRTPLTGIRWGEELLLKTKLSVKSNMIVQNMYDSTLRLQESIEDILQLANWQSGKSQQLLITSTDITHLLNGIFATQKLPAAQKDVRLEYARNWPETLVINIDSQRLKRVFNNLISNAIKYAYPNTTVVVAYEKVGSNHIISIKDHGIGIPANEQDKVFAGFYRASNAISKETNGTGMGLYMSKSTIEQHRGELWLTSEESKGTTVYLKLPG